MKIEDTIGSHIKPEPRQTTIVETLYAGSFVESKVHLAPSRGSRERLDSAAGNASATMEAQV
jgi:hypothetical protein